MAGEIAAIGVPYALTPTFWEVPRAKHHQPGPTWPRMVGALPRRGGTPLVEDEGPGSSWPEAYRHAARTALRLDTWGAWNRGRKGGDRAAKGKGLFMPAEERAVTGGWSAGRRWPMWSMMRLLAEETDPLGPEFRARCPRVYRPSCLRQRRRCATGGAVAVAPGPICRGGHKARGPFGGLCPPSPAATPPRPIFFPRKTETRQSIRPASGPERSPQRGIAQRALPVGRDLRAGVSRKRCGRRGCRPSQSARGLEETQGTGLAEFPHVALHHGVEIAQQDRVRRSRADVMRFDLVRS